MGLLKRIPGELLHLEFQLTDGTDTMPKRVFVRLRDEFGLPVSNNLIELLHVGEGYFVESFDPQNDVRKISSIDNNPSDLFGRLDDSDELFGLLDDGVELIGVINEH